MFYWRPTITPAKLSQVKIIYCRFLSLDLLQVQTWCKFVLNKRRKLHLWGFLFSGEVFEDFDHCQSKQRKCICPHPVTPQKASHNHTPRDENERKYRHPATVTVGKVQRNGEYIKIKNIRLNQLSWIKGDSFIDLNIMIARCTQNKLDAHDQ